MQNIYAPLPLTAHLIFCTLATLLYATLFNRRGKKHYLVIMIAIDLTLMTQFWTDKVVIFALGFSEAVLLILAAALAIKSGREEKAREEERLRREQLEIEKKAEKQASEKLFVKQEYIDKQFDKYNPLDDDDDF